MWSNMFSGILSQPWARRVAANALAALTIILFLFNLRRAGEQSGRTAERLENVERTHAIQRKMLEAASHRPRSRDDLLNRLREGGF